MPKDLTEKQFLAACNRRGIARKGFGYYNVGNGLNVYRWNAGNNRRAQLAYLIREQEKER